MEWLGMPGAWVAVRKANMGASWMAVVRFRRARSMFEATVLKGNRQLEESVFDSEDAGKKWCEERIGKLIREQPNYYEYRKPRQKRVISQ